MIRVSVICMVIDLFELIEWMVNEVCLYKSNVISPVHSCQPDSTSHWQSIRTVSVGLFDLDKSFGVLGTHFCGMTQISLEGHGRGRGLLNNNSTTCQIGARSLSLKHSLFESLCGCLKEVVWPAGLNSKCWVWSQSLGGRLHRGEGVFSPLFKAWRQVAFMAPWSR